MIKNLFVIGTRPEAIKVAPIINYFKKQKNVLVNVVVSGQHKELLDQVLKIFDIEPDINFNIMKTKQTTSYLIYEIIKNLEKKVNKDYDYIYVHGDTTTAMAAALWAFQNKIKIVHIEAGLRTENLYIPFPEESNRRIISQLSYISFCPTKETYLNLVKEQNQSKKFIVGNSAIDALIFVLTNFDNKNDFGNYILLTTHRRENLENNNMSNIFKAADYISKKYNIKVIFPMHPNPKIKQIFETSINVKNTKIKIVKPFDYINFSNVMNNAKLIMTDSGGIQEEAFYLKKKILILREETERKEITNELNVRVVGSSFDKIINSFDDLYSKEISISNNEIYGNGTTSKQIYEIIQDDFKKNNNSVK